MRRLAAWTLRCAIGPDRAATVLGDLAEELDRSPLRLARTAGLRLLWRAATFAIAVRWAERAPRPRIVSASWQDLRYAFRAIRTRPVTSAAAIGLLGLAIGITTAMFTVVDALLIRPVPFADADRLVHLHMGSARGGALTVPVAVYDAWRNLDGFGGVEALATSTGLVETDAGPIAREISRVTPGLFELIGNVQPLLGRAFVGEDGRPGADDRVLISESLWRAALGGDASIVGSLLNLNGKPVVVVGVLPGEFRFPDWRTAIWQATTFEAEPGAGANGPRVSVYVRLSAQVPADDARRVATASAYAAGGSRSTSAQTRPLSGSNLDDIDVRTVRLLTGGVALLFVLLCANVSSLMLAGLTAREHEIGTRAALGASRRRLVCQAFLEHSLLGLAGIGAGLAAGWALVSAAGTLLPEAVLLQSLNPLNLDTRALVVSSMLGFAATVGVGTMPALVGTRVNPSRSLKAAARAGTEPRRTRQLTRALLVGQVAISCTLLIGATVLVRSFARLASADRGLDVSDVVVAGFSLTDAVHASPSSRAAAARAIIEHAQAFPGVSHAAWSYGTPPLGASGYNGNWTADGPGAVPRHAVASRSFVDGRYFSLYRIPIVRGRSFLESDGVDAAVLSQRLAREVFGDQDPVGRYVTFDGEPDPERIRVVGVAGDARLPSVDPGQDRPQLYRPFVSSFTPMLSLRCPAGCPNEGALRRHLGAAAPAAVIQRVSVVERRYFAELARPRAAAALALAFAVTALLATSAGLFSLLTFAVTRRRRELGIRSALGAPAASLRRLIWRDGAMVVAVGIGLGALGGASLARLMASQLYEVTMADPLSWSVVTATIVVAFIAASWRPARTAMRTDLLRLLREE